MILEDVTMYLAHDNLAENSILDFIFDHWLDSKLLVQGGTIS